MNDLILEVTQEDIDKGKSCNSVECPIALALLRKFNIPQEHKQGDDMNPNDVGVRVGLTTCGVFTKDSSTYYNLSEEAQDFIMAFDEVARGNDRNNIKPATFILHTRKVDRKYRL